MSKHAPRSIATTACVRTDCFANIEDMGVPHCNCLTESYEHNCPFYQSREERKKKKAALQERNDVVWTHPEDSAPRSARS